MQSLLLLLMLKRSCSRRRRTAFSCVSRHEGAASSLHGWACTWHDPDAFSPPADIASMVFHAPAQPYPASQRREMQPVPPFDTDRGGGGGRGVPSGQKNAGQSRMQGTSTIDSCQRKREREGTLRACSAFAAQRRLREPPRHGAKLPQCSRVPVLMCLRSCVGAR